MDIDDLCQFLHRLRFLSQFPIGTLREFTEGATLRTLAPGEVLFHEGDEDHHLYVVSRGRVSLSVQVADRGAIPILTVESGDLLGWSSLLRDGRMAATATALDDVQVAVLSGAHLRQLCERDSQIGYSLMRQVALALARRLLRTREQLVKLLVEAPEG
jgi:CRP-like cAMP-binding protein